jgi:hypothetical protein
MWGEGMGEVLDKPELVWAAWLWDDTDRRCLKRADEGLDFFFRQGADVSPFGQLRVHDGTESLTVLDRGRTVRRGIGEGDGGDAGTETRSEAGWDVGELCNEAGLCEVT